VRVPSFTDGCGGCYKLDKPRQTLGGHVVDRSGKGRSSR
jgi:hypothetical protein